MNAQLAAAYSVCRGITRQAARNFYYGFLVLPRRKRDALSAVYAFMRRADDICDDPALAVDDKRSRLASLLDSLRQILAGRPTDDPVLFALTDAQKRFKIDPGLLEKLVYGTSMDLAPSTTGKSDVERFAEHAMGTADAGGGAPATTATLVRYRTFDELHQYCYYVASVVGLICIRIFGYRDPAAEALAERVGVAFQLTNIIRDVKEDAAMGRVYLPEEELVRAKLEVSDVRDGLDVARLRSVLEALAQRAREFYRAADELLPLIEKDSQPAFWALVQIYRRLLEKIAKRNYDVFTERVRLSVPEKLRVLSKGFLRRIV